MLHSSIDIWKEETYLGDSNDGFRPRLDTYILNGDKKRAAVLICPGGGYRSTSEREAEPIALQFNAAGFHAFVLYYSVAPRRHPQPLLDVSRAMCIIRNQAQEWNVDAEKIAVCGFSAGGHLAASLGVHWDKPYLSEISGIEKGLTRPNALILCYPVITTGSFAHRGSFNNLLGPKPSEYIPEKPLKQAGYINGSDSYELLLHEMSLERHINKNTPPAFIWHTFADNAVPVENSLLFALELRKNNIPFELHIYPDGPHGLSLATKETQNLKLGIYPHVATWMNLCIEWIQNLFG